MHARFPRWLWLAGLPAIAGGVMLGLWLFGAESIGGSGGTLSAMQDIAFVSLSLAAALILVLVAALVAFAFGWRPAGWDGPDSDDDGGGWGGGGSGGGPDVPLGPPSPVWDDFDRLRYEWEMESRPALRS